MTIKSFVISISSIVALSSFSVSALAEGQVSVPKAIAAASEEFGGLDELDPTDPNIEEKLNALDEQYREETGNSPFVFKMPQFFDNGCQLQQCDVYIDIVKAEQKAYLYVYGSLMYEWDVSTGRKGYSTPDMSKKPNGRIYTSYMSKAYPGGDYKGLGNMPYAVFIRGGYAVHGTGKSNWKLLGQRASHGCIRMHPDNAKIFNDLVRSQGVDNTWIRVR